MDLKKRYNYTLRLFLPIALLLFLMVAALILFHIDRSEQARLDVLKANTDLISNRILETFNGVDDSDNRKAFMNFIDDFYANTEFDDVSVTVYDNATGRIVDQIGFVQPTPEQFMTRENGVVKASKVIVTDSEGNEVDLNPAKAIFYRNDTTADQRYTIQTLMPMTAARERQDQYYSESFIVIIVVAAGVCGFFIWLFASHLGRNITLLHDFVQSAMEDKNFDPNTKFPNDELGDISKRIVQFYEQRQAATSNLEREHNVALRATEEKNAVKRQLTDNINHELKTPIGIIKGYVDTLLENPDMDPATHTHFLQKVSVQVTRIVDMLNDISTITRLDEGAMNIPTECVDFHNVAFTAANDITESGVSKNMTFSYDIPFDCNIRGNFNLLVNVINNLAKNAAAYSNGTEMGLKLIASNNRFYTFSFYDNGKGIPAEHLPHIFERFYRVDTGRSRKNGGTGLGLPIVRSTIMTMGGTISVRNRKEGGLEFLFTLPVYSNR